MTNSELTRTLMLQLLKTRMSFRQALVRIFRKHNVDITFEMFQVMYRLREQQGVSQQCLAEQIAKDKACMTNLINNLEKKGLVERREDPADRRNRCIFLTREGDELIDRLRPCIKDLYNRAGESMNDKRLMNCINELTKLSDVLDKL